jgi:hypothetical protein
MTLCTIPLRKESRHLHFWAIFTTYKNIKNQIEYQMVMMILLSTFPTIHKIIRNLILL